MGWQSFLIIIVDIVMTTSLNLEFGFNVPRQLIYEALTDQK